MLRKKLKMDCKVNDIVYIPPPPDEDKYAPKKSSSIQSTKNCTSIKLNHEDEL